MLDVLAALRAMGSPEMCGQVTAVLSQVYFVEGRVCGTIHGDTQRRFPDGRRITTSAIYVGYEALGHQLIRTDSGSLYLIASWWSHSEAWKTLPLGSGIHPLYFAFTVEPDTHSDFSNDVENANEQELKLIQVGLPNQQRDRSVMIADDALSDPDQARKERNSHIFQLALHLDRGYLERTLELAQETFMVQEQTKVLIECTRRMPDPHLLPLLALGYLPEWQSILVLDGQFNVSQKATDHLAISLLAVLPTDDLYEGLRDLRFQIDLGV